MSVAIDAQAEPTSKDAFDAEYGEVSPESADEHEACLYDSAVCDTQTSNP